jgi:mRNA interferase MazF
MLVLRLFGHALLLNRGEPARAGGLPRDSKAQAEQVRSLDAERIGEQLGRLPDRLMASLDDALRLHLAL